MRWYLICYLNLVQLKVLYLLPLCGAFGKEGTYSYDNRKSRQTLECLLGQQLFLKTISQVKLLERTIILFQSQITRSQPKKWSDGKNQRNLGINVTYMPPFPPLLTDSILECVSVTKHTTLCLRELIDFLLCDVTIGEAVGLHTTLQWVSDFQNSHIEFTKWQPHLVLTPIFMMMYQI